MTTLEHLLRRAPLLVIRMALDAVRTLGGALQLQAAERAGKGRPSVLRMIDRRIAELRGEDPPTSTPLIVAAEALDPERVAWEESRIVAAVGRGKWTGRL